MQVQLCRMPTEIRNQQRTERPLQKLTSPLTCSDCKKLFSTPSAFKKHKYIHYEFMYECETCSKGFHFESELSMHRRKHTADQGLVCFHAKCGKRFKCSSKTKGTFKKTIQGNQLNVTIVRTPIETLEM